MVVAAATRGLRIFALKFGVQCSDLTPTILGFPNSIGPGVHVVSIHGKPQHMGAPWNGTITNEHVYVGGKEEEEVGPRWHLVQRLRVRLENHKFGERASKTSWIPIPLSGRRRRIRTMGFRFVMSLSSLLLGNPFHLGPAVTQSLWPRVRISKAIM